MKLNILIFMLVSCSIEHVTSVRCPTECMWGTWESWQCNGCCHVWSGQNSAYRFRSVCCSAEPDINHCLAKCHYFYNQTTDYGLCTAHCTCTTSTRPATPPATPRPPKIQATPPLLYRSTAVPVKATRSRVSSVSTAIPVKATTRPRLSSVSTAIPVKVTRSRFSSVSSAIPVKATTRPRLSSVSTAIPVKATTRSRLSSVSTAIPVKATTRPRLSSVPTLKSNIKSGGNSTNTLSSTPSSTNVLIRSGNQTSVKSNLKSTNRITTNHAKSDRTTLTEMTQVSFSTLPSKSTARLISHGTNIWTSLETSTVKQSTSVSTSVMSPRSPTTSLVSTTNNSSVGVRKLSKPTVPSPSSITGSISKATNPGVPGAVPNTSTPRQNGLSVQTSHSTSSKQTLKPSGTVPYQNNQQRYVHLIETIGGSITSDQDLSGPSENSAKRCLFDCAGTEDVFNCLAQCILRPCEKLLSITGPCLFVLGVIVGSLTTFCIMRALFKKRDQEGGSTVHPADEVKRRLNF